MRLRNTWPKIRSRQAELVEARDAHRALTARLATLERTIADQATQLTQLTDRNDRLTTEVQSLAAQRDEASGALREHHETLRDRDARIDVLEAVIDKLSTARNDERAMLSGKR